MSEWLNVGMDPIQFKELINPRAHIGKEYLIISIQTELQMPFQHPFDKLLVPLQSIFSYYLVALEWSSQKLPTTDISHLLDNNPSYIHDH